LNTSGKTDRVTPVPDQPHGHGSPKALDHWN